MRPEYAKHLNRIFALVASGRLPEGAVERIAYMGHTVVYSHGQLPDAEEWKCVGCGATWKGEQRHSCDAPEPYITNHLRTARWRCVSCEHEWEGEDGIRCPVCSDCQHEWGSPDGAPCTYCGKDKDEYMSELPERQRIPGWIPGYYAALLARNKS